MLSDFGETMRDSSRTMAHCVVPVLAVLVSATATAAADEGFVASGSRIITVADGFEVELVAGPPLVERPIAVARDERGRLYVTDSGGMSEKASEQLETKPHRIRRLEDLDGDGIYDRSTLFADRMMFPEGCLWHDGSLYVAAPPQIWKLTDVDDDGVCDQREVWFDGKTLTGCGNDLHGPYRGPDGRFYWCKGAFAEQRHQLADGTEFVTRASHVFRANADGSQLEPVLTGGMDNPVNVAFLPNGDRFLSCTFLQYPSAGKRDGLLHAVYGGVHGKRHASIFDHPRTGDVMPVLVHMGAAAPCGLTAGSRSLFAGSQSQSLYACYFNLHQVVQHRLVADGATWTTDDTVLLTSEHPDFHPTDVFEDADGSLLVVDTGGWYKVCCPTSLLAKPDVLGGIYRVRQKGVTTPPDAMGLGIPWEQLNRQNDFPALSGLLADDRLFVRRRAGDLLRAGGDPAAQAIRAAWESMSAGDVRCDAVWVLSGIGSPAARKGIRDAFNDSDVRVRSAAATAAGLLRDDLAHQMLQQQLLDDQPSVRRAAAEALGRIGSEEAIPALLAALAALPHWEPDAVGVPQTASQRVLQHSLTYALIELDRPGAFRSGLTHKSAAVRQACLLALDQARSSEIRSSDLIPALTDVDPRVRLTAEMIAGEHPEWSADLVAFLRLRMSADIQPEFRDSVIRLVAKLSSATQTQALLAELVAGETRRDVVDLALDAMGQSTLSSLPAAWRDALASRITHTDAAVTARIVETLSNFPRLKDADSTLAVALRRLAESEQQPADLRINAARRLPPLQQIDDQLLQFLLDEVVNQQHMARATSAAELLGAAQLTDAQREQLLEVLPGTGPLQLPGLLPLLQTRPSAEYGHRLLTALRSSPAVSALRQEQMIALFKDFPADVRRAGEDLMAAHFVSASQQASHVTTLLETLPPGNAQRGQELFVGAKAACLTCHKLGYHGGNLGPDLTSIARVRQPAELLEAILYPDATIVRGYEPVTLELKQGQIVGGIITNEAADWVQLGINGKTSLMLERSEIEQLLPSQTSPMPKGIEKLLNDQELADLLAFLNQRR
jgi:putative membrane-bound dehydrogenase-like protein